MLDIILLQKCFSESILSSSGWRKIFNKDRRDNSLSPDICSEDVIFASFCTRVIASIWLEIVDNPCVFIGIDSRPTGPTLLKICTSEFLRLGIKALNCDILPITEIMSSCQQTDSVDGFFYISASHNPPGYNGFKFGLSDGKILPGEKVKQLVEKLKELIFNPFEMFESFDNFKNSKLIPDLDFSVQKTLPNVKKQTLQDYEKFLCKIACNQDDSDTIISEIKQVMLQDPLGVVIDFNGSSRILSCDCHYLEFFGVQTTIFGDIVGKFGHDIVPEGKSLLPCQKMLEQQHKKHSFYTLGYVPDCDGDRGNLVVYDIDQAKAIPLGSQDVFCLCILSELCYLKSIKKDWKNVAVVVNAATSLRINYVCSVFGVCLFIVETGEANVVQKADELRILGFCVRCYGEGSNGGSIIYPSTGRDPLNMLTSVIKLLYLRDKDNGLMAIWCRLLKIGIPKIWSLNIFLKTLPRYQTTNVFEGDSVIKGIKDQVITKTNYVKIFKYLWPFVKEKLQEMIGIQSYSFISYEGITELSDPISLGTGGLRILFLNSQKEAVCFFWLRASKTEPVMRVMVDVKHEDDSIYHRLYNYHCAILLHAISFDISHLNYDSLKELLLSLQDKN